MTDIYDLGSPAAFNNLFIWLLLAGLMGALIIRFALYRHVVSFNAILADKGAVYHYFRRVSKEVSSPTFQPETQLIVLEDSPVEAQPEPTVEQEQIADVAEKPVVKIQAPKPAKPTATPTIKVPRQVPSWSPLPSLNFDRIGRDRPEDSDDLTRIAGIGPNLQNRLNTLGIYTYRQIANFTPEDALQVTQLAEFIPGRIERDDWVGQARKLYARKYISPN